MVPSAWALSPSKGPNGGVSRRQQSYLWSLLTEATRQTPAKRPMASAAPVRTSVLDAVDDGAALHFRAAWRRLSTADKPFAGGAPPISSKAAGTTASCGSRLLKDRLEICRADGRRPAAGPAKLPRRRSRLCRADGRAALAERPGPALRDRGLPGPPPAAPAARRNAARLPFCSSTKQIVQIKAICESLAADLRSRPAGRQPGPARVGAAGRGRRGSLAAAKLGSRGPSYPQDPARFLRRSARAGSTSSRRRKTGRCPRSGFSNFPAWAGRIADCVFCSSAWAPYGKPFPSTPGCSSCWPRPTAPSLEPGPSFRTSAAQSISAR